jgi:hypothetical protein
MTRSRCPWFALLLLIVCVSPAFALEPGTILIGANVTAGSADFVTSDGKFLSAYEHGEVGAGLETWYFLDDDMALTIGGGIGKFREKQKSGTTDQRFYSQNSWNMRLGIDQVIDFSRDAMLFFGPGLEYWTGHSRFDGFGAATDGDTPDVMRLSLSARFGGMVILGDSYGLTGRIGYRMGWARAKDGDAETTWYPNGFDAAAGLVYSF